MHSGPSPRVDTQTARRPRWRAEAAYVLLWLGAAWFWLVPRLFPRGPYFGGHMSLADFYAGLPIAVAAIGATTVRLLPRRYQRPIGLRLAAIGLALWLGAVAVDSIAVAWRMARWDYWFDYHKVIRNGNHLDPLLGWVRDPNIVWMDKDAGTGGALRYTTDENGFRNPRGLRSADIVFVGDSFTESVAFSTEEAFPGVVGAVTGLKVANLGRSGYGPPQELIVLQKYAVQYHPRVVVWQIYEGNDLVDAEHYVRWIADPKRAIADARPHGILQAYQKFSPLVWYLSKTWAQHVLQPFARYPDGRTQAMRKWDIDTYDPDALRAHPLGVKASLDAVDEGYRFCRARGIRLLVLFAPMRNRVYDPYLIYQRPGDMMRLLPGPPDGNVNDFDSVLGRHCAQIGCPYLDLYPLLKARAATDIRRLFFLDDIHLDLRGHEVVAHAIIDWLRANAQRPPA